MQKIFRWIAKQNTYSKIEPLFVSRYPQSQVKIREMVYNQFPTITFLVILILQNRNLSERIQKSIF